MNHWTTILAILAADVACFLAGMSLGWLRAWRKASDLLRLHMASQEAVNEQLRKLVEHRRAHEQSRGDA